VARLQISSAFQRFTTSTRGTEKPRTMPLLGVSNKIQKTAKNVFPTIQKTNFVSLEIQNLLVFVSSKIHAEKSGLSAFNRWNRNRFQSAVTTQFVGTTP
jgi:hypothetical protein